jgi:hypothetical protein
MSIKTLRPINYYYLSQLHGIQVKMSVKTPQFIDYKTTASWLDTQVKTYLNAQGIPIDDVPTITARNVEHHSAVERIVDDELYHNAWSDVDDGNDKILRLGLAVGCYDIHELTRKVMPCVWDEEKQGGEIGLAAVKKIDKFELAAYSALQLAHRYGLTLIALNYSEMYEN